jgi:hypothetical protein
MIQFKGKSCPQIYKGKCNKAKLVWKVDGWIDRVTGAFNVGEESFDGRGKAIPIPVPLQRLPGRHIRLPDEVVHEVPSDQWPRHRGCEGRFATATAYRIEADPRLPSQKQKPRGRRQFSSKLPPPSVRYE